MQASSPFIRSPSSSFPETSSDTFPDKVCLDIARQDSHTRLTDWLTSQSLVTASITPQQGLTNHVFRVALADGSATDWPRQFIVRMVNQSISSGLNPLQDNFDTITAIHRLAAELGLAPAVVATDVDRQLMALVDCGDPRPLAAYDMPEITALAQRLRDAAPAWAEIMPTATGELATLPAWSLLGEIAGSHRQSAALAQQLLDMGDNAGLSALPLVPSHSDWNPGNWLHDGQRWWLIDWDFAGWRPMWWDWASLVVEHQWSWQQAQRWLAPSFALDQTGQHCLPWFCATMALIAKDWYEQRESEHSHIRRAQTAVEYWWDICQFMPVTAFAAHQITTKVTIHDTEEHHA